MSIALIFSMVFGIRYFIFTGYNVGCVSEERMNSTKNMKRKIEDGLSILRQVFIITKNESVVSVC